MKVLPLRFSPWLRPTSFTDKLFLIAWLRQRSHSRCCSDDRASATLCSCGWMIFEGFAPVKIKIVVLLGEDPNTNMIERVCIFMCNFLSYTAALNQNFGVLLIHTFKHTTSFKLSLPGHSSRFEYFTEVLMKVQFCGVRCHVDRFTLIVSGNCLSVDTASYTRRLESSRRSWLHDGTQTGPLPMLTEPLRTLSL